MEQTVFECFCLQLMELACILLFFSEHLIRGTKPLFDLFIIQETLVPKQG